MAERPANFPGLTDAAIVATLGLLGVFPSAVTLGAFALAVANYNARRWVRARDAGKAQIKSEDFEKLKFEFEQFKQEVSKATVSGAFGRR